MLKTDSDRNVSRARGAFRVFRVFRGHQVLTMLLLASAAEAQRAPYYPPANEWARRAPEQSGFDPAKLQAAVDYAKTSESPTRTDSASLVRAMSNEPFNDIIGPIKLRGGVSGMVVRNGYIVAEWGDT